MATEAPSSPWEKLQRTRTFPSVSTSAASSDHASSSDDESVGPISRSKTLPGICNERLSLTFPGLVVRNTFMDFETECPTYLKPRRARSAEPSEGSRTNSMYSLVSDEIDL